MPIDIVKPLKIEEKIEGFDLLPTETNPQEDYLSCKGIAFRGDASLRIDATGYVIMQSHPDHTTEVVYNNLASPTSITIYKDSSIKLIEITITYDSHDSPITERLDVYDVDGTTIGYSLTRAYTYLNNELVNIQVTST